MWLMRLKKFQFLVQLNRSAKVFLNIEMMQLQTVGVCSSSSSSQWSLRMLNTSCCNSSTVSTLVADRLTLALLTSSNTFMSCWQLSSVRWKRKSSTTSFQKAYFFSFRYSYFWQDSSSRQAHISVMEQLITLWECGCLVQMSHLQQRTAKDRYCSHLNSVCRWKSLLRVYQQRPMYSERQSMMALLFQCDPSSGFGASSLVLIIVNSTCSHTRVLQAHRNWFMLLFQKLYRVWPFRCFEQRKYLYSNWLMVSFSRFMWFLIRKFRPLTPAASGELATAIRWSAIAVSLAKQNRQRLMSGPSVTSISCLAKGSSSSFSFSISQYIRAFILPSFALSAAIFLRKKHTKAGQIPTSSSACTPPFSTSCVFQISSFISELSMPSTPNWGFISILLSIRIIYSFMRSFLVVSRQPNTAERWLARVRLSGQAIIRYLEFRLQHFFSSSLLASSVWVFFMKLFMYVLMGIFQPSDSWREEAVTMLQVSRFTMFNALYISVWLWAVNDFRSFGGIFSDLPPQVSVLSIFLIFCSWFSMISAYILVNFGSFIITSIKAVN